jgi:hypothetical protein
LERFPLVGKPPNQLRLKIDGNVASAAIFLMLSRISFRVQSTAVPFPSHLPVERGDLLRPRPTEQPLGENDELFNSLDSRHNTHTTLDLPPRCLT